MTYQEHSEAARMCVAGSLLLEREGMGMVVAEALWGAAIHALEAANHARTPRHFGNNRDRVRFLAVLSLKYNLGAFLDDGFTAVRDRLHNHFYTGMLSDQDLLGNLIIGRAFVNQLLELVEREHGI